MQQMVEVAAREECVDDRRDGRCRPTTSAATASSRPARPADRVGADHAHRRKAEARHDAVDARGRRPLRADAADLPPPAHDAAGAGGEIQLTDGIARLLAEEAVLAYAFEGRRYDCGRKLGYLEATVDFGLKHPETAPRTSRAFLRERERQPR